MGEIFIRKALVLKSFHVEMDGVKSDSSCNLQIFLLAKFERRENINFQSVFSKSLASMLSNV